MQGPRGLVHSTPRSWGDGPWEAGGRARTGHDAFLGPDELCSVVTCRLTGTPQASPCGLEPLGPRTPGRWPVRRADAAAKDDCRRREGTGLGVKGTGVSCTVWCALWLPACPPPLASFPRLWPRPCPGPQHSALRLRAPRQHSPPPSSLPHPEPSARQSSRSASCRGCQPPRAPEHPQGRSWEVPAAAVSGGARPSAVQEAALRCGGLGVGCAR